MLKQQSGHTGKRHRLLAKRHGMMQDVGLLREVKAVKKPGCPVCGPRGVAYDQGTIALSQTSVQPVCLPVLT
jgi:hypothetical protein